MKNITITLSAMLAVFVLHSAVAPALADDLQNDHVGVFHNVRFNGDMGSWTFLPVEPGSPTPDRSQGFPDYNEYYSQTLGVWSDMATGDHPSAGANLTDRPQQFWSANWAAPPRSVYLHPGQDRHAAVNWDSKRLTTLMVDVQFEFRDMDDDCGDGVNWFVRHGARDLMSGSFGNGGGSGVQTLPRFNIGPGDWSDESLFFIVGPGAGVDHSCDATALNVHITTPDPLPVLFANNSSGPLRLTKGTPITLAASLACAGLKGQDIEYWAFVWAPLFDEIHRTFFYDYAQGVWRRRKGPAYSGPCVNFNRAEILNMPGWSPGGYRGLFGFDTVLDGKMTQESFIYDFVTINYYQ